MRNPYDAQIQEQHGPDTADLPDAICRASITRCRYQCSSLAFTNRLDHSFCDIAAPPQGAGAGKKSRDVRSAEDVIRRSLRLGSGMNQEPSIVAKLL